MMKQMIVFAAVFLLFGSIIPSFLPAGQAGNAAVVWSCTIEGTETAGSIDYVVIGEAADAHDGPPADMYDVVKPPAPMVPFLRVWLNDSLPSPYDFLWKDYRHYPGITKIWNLSIQWDPSDYTSPTTVTITWNSTDLRNSEYGTFLLCTETGTPLQDMLLTTSYTFSCPALVTQHFLLQAQRANAPPDTPLAPAGTLVGDHGVSYTYTTSTTDPNNDTVYYLFNWGDTSPSGWLGPYESGSTVSASHFWQAPGSYPISVQARDSLSHESNWSNTTMVTMMNQAPDPPRNESPSDGATAVSITPLLRWVGSDPDSDTLAYDVYFGTNQSPSRVVENQSSSWFSPGTLAYQKTYYWRIVVKDGFGGQANGALWSFTTVAPPPGGGGAPPGGGVNHPPTANASASDHVGLVGASLVFNGSLSTDSDGYITKWFWEFGDGTSGNGEVTTHAYTKAGTYTVVLTVLDNNGTNDTDTLQIIITTANHAPTRPSLTGTTLGLRNIVYSYSLVSTDPDGDFLQYLVIWGDGSSTMSDFLPNGTVCSLTHSWSSPGKFLIEATVSDNVTVSEKTELAVFIDVHFLGALGFLYDRNGDGVYDTFFSNATGNTTSVQRLSNGTYLVDSNGDGVWNYYYNPTTDTFTVIGPVAATDNQYIFFVVIGAVIIVIVVIAYWYRKRRF
jgi:PKD repeat protein